MRCIFGCTAASRSGRIRRRQQCSRSFAASSMRRTTKADCSNSPCIRTSLAIAHASGYWKSSYVMRASAAAFGSQRMLKWSNGPAHTLSSDNFECLDMCRLRLLLCQRVWSHVRAGKKEQLGNLLKRIALLPAFPHQRLLAFRIVDPWSLLYLQHPLCLRKDYCVASTG